MTPTFTTSHTAAPCTTCARPKKVRDEAGVCIECHKASVLVAS